VSARRQIIAALSEDSHGGIATLEDVTRAEQLVDAYRAEVLAEAKNEVVAWLVKKAAEGCDTGSLASKVDRGAIRIFLGTGHYRDAMDTHRAEVLAEAAEDLARRVLAGGPRARGLAFGRLILTALANGELPEEQRGYARHPATAKALRAAPGTWLPVSDYPSRESARSIAWSIRRGRFPAYEPDGAFETRIEPTPTGSRVLACFVGTTRKDS
jgi:hypothetical protein